jgi:hypothetical protein
MIAVRGLYEEGKITLLEPAPDVARAPVAIVFLETETVEDVLASYAAMGETMDWGERMDEEGARTLVSVHEELAPFRAEVNQTHLDPDAE